MRDGQEPYSSCPSTFYDTLSRIHVREGPFSRGKAHLFLHMFKNKLDDYHADPCRNYGFSCPRVLIESKCNRLCLEMRISMSDRSINVTSED